MPEASSSNPTRRQADTDGARGTPPAAWVALVVIISIAEAIVWFGLPYTWEGLPDRWRYRSHFLVAILAFLPLAALPPVRALVVGLLDRLRKASPASQWAMALTLGLVAALLALWRVSSGGQPLYPLLHDEHSYLLQAQHLARLRLWMPAHPLADFFDSFHIVVEPVYASIYWPGTGLFNVWGAWLNLPHYVVPLALYGATVALTCIVASEATDAATGLLAGLVIAAQPHLAAFSTLVMSQVPTAFLGVALLWAFMRWRNAPPRRRLAWSAVLGGLAGWMAITRPVDALCFAVPIAVAAAWMTARPPHPHGRESEGSETAARRFRGLFPMLAVTVLAALPFLALQVVLNQGTTGNPLHPPYVQYLNRFQPGTEFGAGGTPGTARQVSALPQKQELYEAFVVEELRRRREKGAGPLFIRERVPMTFQSSLPSLWLLPLPIVGAVVAVTARRRAAKEGRPVDPLVPRLALAAIALFTLLYAVNPFFLSHYALPLAVPMTLLAASGIRAIEERLPGGMRRFLTTLIAGALVAGFVLGVVHYRFARPFPWLTEQPDLQFKYEKLPATLGGRALVLVRYVGSGEDASFHWEPVYNATEAWPDEADIVWAHDLNGRREEILAYYAQRHPDRRVILWDRTEGAWYDAGPVTQALTDQRSGALDQKFRDPSGMQPMR